MRKFQILFRRELSAYFLSPVAYVTIVAFLLAAGGTFLLEVFRNVGGRDPVHGFLFNAIVVWMTLLITAVTMRLFAEEKRSGALEALLTAPVGEAEVVLAKYAAAWVFVAVVVSPVVLSAFLLQRMSPGLPPLDAGAMGVGCAFLALFAMLGVAVGELVSLTTRNQIVAAICSFCALWLVLLGGWLLTVLPLGLARVGRYVSATAHLEAMSRGILDTRTIVLFLSVSAFVLFAAVRVLEARRWR